MGPAAVARAVRQSLTGRRDINSTLLSSAPGEVVEILVGRDVREASGCDIKANNDSSTLV